MRSQYSTNFSKSLGKDENGDELNVIKDQAIKEWNDLEVSEYPYSDGKVSIPSSIHKSNLDKMQKYIEMNIKS